MKSSNKKIVVVILTGLAVTGPSLPQGFISYATSSRLLSHYLLKDYAGMEIYDIIDDFGNVKNNQDKHDYDALYLGNSDQFYSKYNVKKSSSGNRYFASSKGIKDKYYHLEPGINTYFFVKFSSGWDFLEKINKLGEYRRLNQSIIVQVGNSFFKIYFNLTPHERSVLPIKLLAPQYSFGIAYSDWNGFYGKTVMESHLYNRDDLKNNPQLREELEKEPKKENIFANAEDFAHALRNGYHHIPYKLTRYRIGPSDFILYK